MRICVLLSAYTSDSSPVAGLDPMFDPTPWLRGHEVDVVVVHKPTAVAQVRALGGRRYDVCLNLCDGTWFEDVAGVEVIEELERLGLPYTGPSAPLYALTKDEMKRAAVALGVRTPAYVFARGEADLERAARLRFPLIVKHFDGCASMGMTRASRVVTREDLAREARAMIAEAGAALIEEFIEGDEYTVLVAEDPDAPESPICFTPIRCAFPPGETFKHFELKWCGYEGLTWRPCADPALADRLAEATRRMFAGIGGESYSRCDFRVDAEGTPWLLEINTSCGVFYPPGAEGCADMILKLDPIGHQGFLDHLLRCALVRARRPRVAARAASAEEAHP
jgi:D-alanine-D-alanine ligase